jgi:hypothetical protein
LTGVNLEHYTTMPMSKALLLPAAAALSVLASAVAVSAQARTTAPAAAAPVVLESPSFRIVLDPYNGSLAELLHPADSARMNWVSSGTNAPWQPRSFQWGLGYADVGALSLHRGRW